MNEQTPRLRPRSVHIELKQAEKRTASYKWQSDQIERVLALYSAGIFTQDEALRFIDSIKSKVD